MTPLQCPLCHSFNVWYRPDPVKGGKQGCNDCGHVRDFDPPEQPPETVGDL